MATRKKLDHNEYVVGWICPLEVEQIAALLMLDELHERLPQDPVDHNVYNLGSINGHNVVIAGLPTAGNNSAATVVNQMRNTFRSLRFCLLVGIGGGVPTTSDSRPIRLGDVVVSKPSGEHSGAVQYDHGKAEVGTFKRTGHLQSPPRVLLNAAQDLASQRAIGDEDPISEHLKRFKTKKREQRRFKFPGRENDHLYRSDYIHEDSKSSCEKCGCDASQRLCRANDDSEEEEDDEAYVFIHRGTVASGELVMRNGIQRDYLAKDLGVLCFEMEAAGALNDCPCLVIRGISDYSDSHKNDKWHGYAAAVAAAYARQLFFHMPVDDVKKCTVAVEDIAQMQEGIANLQQHVHSSHKQKILDWLSPIDYATQQNDFIRRRQPGTGQWLLDSNEFKNWFTLTKQTLFCPGMPGAGKTIMTSIVIDFLHHQSRQDRDMNLAYVFCNFKQEEVQKLENLLANLLKQLIQEVCQVPDFVQHLYEFHKNKGTRPSLEELIRTLTAAMKLCPRTFILIDALDECQLSDGCRKKFLQALFDAQNETRASVFATSRYVSDIEIQFKECARLEIRASKKDIGTYIHGRMGDLSDFVSTNLQLQEVIETTVTEVVDGMFLLAQLHMDSLKDGLNLKSLRQILKNLPSGEGAYKKAYAKVMERIQGQSAGMTRLALDTLSWIVHAKRPLTTLELQYALAIEVGESNFDEDNITEIATILSACAGIVTVEQESSPIRLIHFTAQEYFRETHNHWFPSRQMAIALDCVAFLSSDSFGNFFSWDDDHHQPEYKLAEYPFYPYATEYWGYHVRDASLQTDQTVIALFNSQEKTGVATKVLNRLNFCKGSSPINLTLQSHLVIWFDLRQTLEYLIREGLHPDAKDLDGMTLSMIAAELGCTQTTKLLLDEGADIKLEAGNGKSLLDFAVESGNMETFTLVLQKGLEIKAWCMSHLNAAFFLSCRWGLLPVVKTLMSYGVDINHRSSKVLYEEWIPPEAVRPLLVACRGHHWDIVQLLLDRGVDVSLTGGSTMHYVSEVGIAEQLLARGALLDERDRSGRTPLMKAASRRLSSLVDLLIQKGARISAEDRYEKQTALHYAVKKGCLGSVKSLLQACRKLSDKQRLFIDAQDIEGRTALHHAAWLGYLDIVKLLDEAGADLRALEHRGKSALTLMISAEYNKPLGSQKWPSIVDYLMKQRKSDEDIPVLFVASWMGQKDLVQELLDEGADVNASAGYGSALYLTSAQNRKEIVKLLVAHGAWLEDSSSPCCRTPLMAASRNGFTDIVTILIEAGADVNSVDLPGETPLMAASRNGFAGIVTILIEAGADVNSVMVLGKTALSWARLHGHQQVEDILLAAGATSTDDLGLDIATQRKIIIDLCRPLSSDKTSATSRLLTR